MFKFEQSPLFLPFKQVLQLSFNISVRAMCNLENEFNYVNQKHKVAIATIAKPY